MKRKLVALVLAIMLVGSCVGAFATTEGRYNNQDIAIINAALAQYYPQEQEMVGYVIKDGGLWMLLSTTTYTLNDTVVSGNAAADLYKYYEDNPTQANMQAYLASVVEKKTSTTPDLVEVDADYVTGKDLDAVKAEHPGYTEVAGFEDESYWLLSNGTNFIIVAKNASTENPDVIGQPTTGTDIFELDYSSFYGDVISAFAFKPEAFGNGIEFSHKNAKSRFTMTVKYDSRIVIQLRDQQGRLYPVSGATYQAADNGYVTTMKADASKTFGWCGTDGAGYHAAGSLKDPAIIELDLNVTVSTTGKNADGTPWATDRGDMRFSYTVRHGEDNHTGNYSGNSGSSSPKTGDARMAYLTLASLVVLAGVAVIITRKLRTNA